MLVVGFGVLNVTVTYDLSNVWKVWATLHAFSTHDGTMQLLLREVLYRHANIILIIRSSVFCGIHGIFDAAEFRKQVTYCCD